MAYIICRAFLVSLWLLSHLFLYSFLLLVVVSMYESRSPFRPLFLVIPVFRFPCFSFSTFFGCFHLIRGTCFSFAFSFSFLPDFDLSFGRVVLILGSTVVYEENLNLKVGLYC